MAEPERATRGNVFTNKLGPLPMWAWVAIVGGGGQPIFNATYVVRPGDTLNSVAKRYHVTREELAHANGYGTGAGLRTGERLKVPSPAGTGTPNRAP